MGVWLQVEWTWDPENCSSMMNVQNDGMDVILKEDEQLEDKVSGVLWYSVM